MIRNIRKIYLLLVIFSFGLVGCSQIATVEIIVKVQGVTIHEALDKISRMSIDLGYVDSIHLDKNGKKLQTIERGESISYPGWNHTRIDESFVVVAPTWVARKKFLYIDFQEASKGGTKFTKQGILDYREYVNALEKEFGSGKVIASKKSRRGQVLLSN